MRGDEKHAEVGEFVCRAGGGLKQVAAPSGRLVGTGDKSNARMRSSTERAIGPITARSPLPDERATGRKWPREGTRSRVGLWANTPQKCAGQRSEPPISEPSASGPKPAASAAEEPPDDPPGRPGEVPGIVGRAVDLVVALPVSEAERHVGLAENDGSGAFEAGHRERVLLGDESLNGVCPRWSATRRCCKIP